MLGRSKVLLVVDGSSKSRNLKYLLLYYCTVFLFAYTFKIKFFAQIVTIAFSDGLKGRRSKHINCDVTKSKSLYKHNLA